MCISLESKMGTDCGSYLTFFHMHWNKWAFLFQKRGEKVKEDKSSVYPSVALCSLSRSNSKNKYTKKKMKEN